MSEAAAPPPPSAYLTSAKLTKSIHTTGHFHPTPANASHAACTSPQAAHPTASCASDLPELCTQFPACLVCTSTCAELSHMCTNGWLRLELSSWAGLQGLPLAPSPPQPSTLRRRTRRSWCATRTDHIWPLARSDLEVPDMEASKKVCGFSAPPPTALRPLLAAMSLFNSVPSVSARTTRFMSRSNMDGDGDAHGFTSPEFQLAVQVLVSI